MNTAILIGGPFDGSALSVGTVPDSIERADVDGTVSLYRHEDIGQALGVPTHVAYYVWDLTGEHQ